MLTIVAACTFIFFNLFRLSTADYYLGRLDWISPNIGCRGDRQSPIDINTTRIVENVFYDFLYFSNYEELAKSVLLTNTGHSLNLDFEYGKSKPYIYGGPLKNNYELDSIHLHWNTKNISAGSEHTINGKRFSLEAHLIHFRSKYKSYEEALSYRDGVAVVAILFELKDSTWSTLLSHIISEAPKVRKPHSNVKIAPFSLGDLRSTKLCPKFAVYTGSLTTPPCIQDITWFVALEPVPVTRKELEMLKYVQLKDNNHHNVRSIQRMNGRIVKSIPLFCNYSNSKH